MAFTWAWLVSRAFFGLAAGYWHESKPSGALHLSQATDRHTHRFVMDVGNDVRRRTLFWVHFSLRSIYTVRCVKRSVLYTGSDADCMKPFLFFIYDTSFSMYRPGRRSRGGSPTRSKNTGCLLQGRGVLRRSPSFSFLLVRDSGSRMSGREEELEWKFMRVCLCCSLVACCLSLVACRLLLVACCLVAL